MLDLCWNIQYAFYHHQGCYVFAWVCLSVCLFVCEHDNSKTYGRILIKFSGYVRNGKRKKRLDFGSDLDHCLDLLDLMKFNF